MEIQKTNQIKWMKMRTHIFVCQQVFKETIEQIIELYYHLRFNVDNDFSDLNLI